MQLLFGFGLAWRGDPFKFVAGIIPFGMCFRMSSSLCILNLYRSITFELPLKQILNIYMNKPGFPPKCIQFMHNFSREIFVVFQYSDSLAYFEISNQNNHCLSGSNNYILTQIMDNLLEINTKRLTWKLLQHGKWITHNKLFWECISLLKTHEYRIINIQAIKIDSHKQSRQIIWKYSKKWQRNGDLNKSITWRVTVLGSWL